jgi:predicted ATPase
MISPENPAYKVAFTGAGGVGKTALLGRMRAEPTEIIVGLIGEAAGSYFMANTDIPENQRYSYHHQSQIQQQAIQAELTAHEISYELIFTDGSVFDAAVCVASTGDEEGAQKLLRAADLWVPGNSDISYSQIYVLDPSDVHFENDDERKETAATRQRQHEEFLDFFTSYGIAHRLLSGTIEERADKVARALPFALKPNRLFA